MLSYSNSEFNPNIILRNPCRVHLATNCAILLVTRNELSVATSLIPAVEFGPYQKCGHGNL